MKIACTICSANYLPQAKTLADSFCAHHPGYRFIVGLVDDVDRELYRDFMQGCEVVPVSQIGIPDFEAMCSRYTIMELNTAVKPAYLRYLFDWDSSVETVIYLDPDIYVFDSFSQVEEALSAHAIALTPHILKPFSDSFMPDEVHFLRAGIYNLGFIALSRCDETMHFLAWWQSRLKDQCFFAMRHGIFVDQLWVTLAPIFFERVYVEKHPGYNMAYWNLQERFLSKKENVWWVNERHKLIFYHYSRYDIRKPDVISPYQNRYDFTKRRDLVSVYDLYRNALIKNSFYDFCDIPCHYAVAKTSTNSMASRCRNILHAILPPFVSQLFGAGKYLRKR